MLAATALHELARILVSITRHTHTSGSANATGHAKCLTSRLNLRQKQQHVLTRHRDMARDATPARAQTHLPCLLLVLFELNRHLVTHSKPLLSENKRQRSARPHLMETSIAPTSLAPLAIALRGSVGMSCPNQETDCQQQTQSSLTTVLFLSASLIFSPSTLSSCLSWSLPRPQSEDLINATRSSSNRLWALIAF